MHLNLTQCPTLELTVDEALKLQLQLNRLIHDVLRESTEEGIASTALTVTNHDEEAISSTIFFHISK